MPAMDRSTLMLLPMRVAFMCNDSDADLVMGPANRETRALSKQGEGILNPLRGDPSHNKPFSGMYIEPSLRSELLAKVRDKAERAGFDRQPRVFDGDTLAVRPPLGLNPVTPHPLSLEFGEPYDLDESAALIIRRSRSNNCLLVGSTDERGEPDAAVSGALHTCILGATHQGAAVFVIDLLGDEPASDNNVSLSLLCSELGVPLQRGQGALRETMRHVVGESRSRHHRTDGYDQEAQVVVVHGIQRALDLAPFDPFVMEDDGEQESDSKVVQEILRDGPDVGIHVVLSVDGLMQFERRLGKESLREFGWRLIGNRVNPTEVATLTDNFKEPVIRANQLLVVDTNAGRNQRMRAYPPLSPSEVQEWRPSGR
jgi:S-DNA-T family DNA segregation ATPase FtsK/SpoIIIE